MRHRRIAVGLIWTLVSAVLVAGCGAAASSGSSSAQQSGGASAAARFYKGKTITWIVPYSPGGGFDVTSRLVAPYLAKATGAKVVVENKPGAGGLVGVNDMAIAKPDGLTVSLVNGPGAVSDSIAKKAGIKKAQGMHFSLNKLSWIGRITGKVDLLYVAPNSKFKTVQQFLRSNQTITYASTGPGGDVYLIGLLVENALGKHLKIVTGYKGSSGVLAAVVRHEVELGNVTADSGSLKVKAGTVRGLLILSTKPYPFLPKVATVSTIKGMISKRGYALIEALAGAMEGTGRALATTPGVPANRVQFLSAALKKALSNPKLIAQAKQHGYVPAYLTGKQELALIQRATANAAVRSLIIKSFKGGK